MTTPGTDRELLELAAKAAGEWPSPEPFEHVLLRWNPLTDDGDALRLAVKIDVCLSIDKEQGRVRVILRDGAEPVHTEPTGADPFAATRRAIVRAAAAIAQGPPKRSPPPPPTPPDTMSTDKLKLLLSRCKCGVHLTVNDHRDVYETVEQWLENMHDFAEDLEPDVREQMIANDTIIDLHFYPNTPVGFYKVLHHDLDAALEEALAITADPT